MRQVRRLSEQASAAVRGEPEFAEQSSVQIIARLCFFPCPPPESCCCSSLQRLQGPFRGASLAVESIAVIIVAPSLVSHSLVAPLTAAP